MATSEQERFLAWWAPVEGTIVAIAMKILSSSDLAAEVAQDIAVAAWQGRSRFDTAEDLQRWCVKRGKWLALDRFRLRKRRLGLLRRYTARLRPPSPPADDILDLAEHVDRLPDRQRRVIKAYFEGRSDGQVAAELGVERATVRSLRRYALQRLTEAFRF